MRGARNGPPPYRVHMSAETRTRIRQLYARAVQNRWGADFVAALRRIVDRLRYDPIAFGEPMFRLPALKLVVYQAASLPLAVIYAVHEQQPLVFISYFKTLS